MQSSKNIKFAILILLVRNFLLCPISHASGNAVELQWNRKSKNPKKMLVEDRRDIVMTVNDEVLILRIEIVNGKKLLRVSFNANEGNEGKLKITTSAGKEVLSAGFELIKFPYYATVDITGLPAGSYTAFLSTQLAVHSNQLVIE